jgi:hypothetical protein
VEGGAGWRRLAKPAGIATFTAKQKGPERTYLAGPNFLLTPEKFPGTKNQGPDSTGRFSMHPI